MVHIEHVIHLDKIHIPIKQVAFVVPHSELSP
jgi:hypothetical protein